MIERSSSLVRVKDRSQLTRIVGRSYGQDHLMFIYQLPSLTPARSDAAAPCYAEGPIPIFAIISQTHR